MRNQITDIIFDLDGTLIDSALSILAGFAATLSSHDIEPIVPLSDALIGPPLLSTLAKISGVEDARLLDSMAEEFKQHYDVTGYKATKVFPGVDGMLRDLRASGFALHIATNKRLRPTRLILSHLGWAELFSAVYASDLRTPPFNSKSEMLAVLLQAEGISPHRAAYVGDRSDDWIAAAETSLRFIAAAWGYRDEKMLAASEQILAADNPGQIGQVLAFGAQS